MPFIAIFEIGKDAERAKYACPCFIQHAFTNNLFEIENG